MTADSPDPAGGEGVTANDKPSDRKRDVEVVTPKPVPTTPAGRSGDPAFQLDADEKRIAVAVEATLTRVIRREVRDPYGGLPADDVLLRLDRQFPQHDFPGRMLARLESEQASRHAHIERIDATDQYVAETDRLNGEAERDLQKRNSRQAERVLWVLVVAGLVLVFTGHEAVGGIVLGTTLVGVVGAFLAQRIVRKSDGEN